MKPGSPDATLVLIRPMVKLRELKLGGQDVTGEGIANLANLDRLESLDLERTKFDDAGFAHLKALRSLKSVDLRGTKITALGLSDYEAAFSQSDGTVRSTADPDPAAYLSSPAMSATIRPARLDDCETITTLILELAAYERP